MTDTAVVNEQEQQEAPARGRRGRAQETPDGEAPARRKRRTIPRPEELPTPKAFKPGPHVKARLNGDTSLGYLRSIVAAAGRETADDSLVDFQSERVELHPA